MNVIVVVETFVAFVLAVTLHEAAHAGMARLLGDNTPTSRYRFSLLPKRQLSPIGTVVAIAQSFNLLTGIGWGKPAEFDARCLRVGPNLGTILVALAGPVLNAILGFGVGLLLHFIPQYDMLGAATNACHLEGSPLPLQGVALQDCLSNLTTQSAVLLRVEQFLLIFAVTNVVLALLNLVPLHPLDGYHILFALLPTSQAIAYRNFAPYMELILLVLLFVVPWIVQLLRLPLPDPASLLVSGAQQLTSIFTGDSIVFYPWL